MNVHDPRPNGAPQETADGVAAIHYDRDKPVHAYVCERARETPNAIALSFAGRTLTYGELDRVSAGLAARLARAGLTKGDVAGLFLPRSLNAVIAMLAILRAGGAYAPIDPAYPPDHLDFVVGDCAPKAIFTDAAHRAKIAAIPSARAVVIDIDQAIADLAGNAEDAPAVRVGGGDVAYLMFTSGSTGRPKGVIVPHRAIARVVLDQNYIRFLRDDVVMHAATIAFDAATLEIWGALVNGCKLAGMAAETFSLSSLSDLMRSEGVTIAWLTTGLFNLFADHATGSLPKLRQLIFGGEVGSAEHARRFMRAHPYCTLTNGYGPTETTVFATAFEVPRDFAGNDLPIGKAIAHTGVHIVDDQLQALPRGFEGQLAISGDGVALGYLNRTGLTAEKFVTIATRDGNLRCYLTGDIAIVGENGIVTFKGRRDRQVKIDGKRIELDEIEIALRRDPNLADAIVTCHAEPGAAKRIVAYLRPRNPARLSDPDFGREAMVALRAVLPAWMIPSCAVVMNEYPLNPAGKVDRAKLAPPPPETPPLPMAASGASASETMLVRLWTDVLGPQASGTDRNFFDLGGTSLQLMRVHAALEAELGRVIDVVALFKHTTIRDLARFLDGKIAGPSRAALAAQRAALQHRNMAHIRRSTT